MKRFLMLFGVTLLFVHSAFAQGTTNATLLCAFHGELNLHMTQDQLSPVIGQVRCGERLLVVDERFAVTHILTEDGLEGYFTSTNIGQWAIEWDASAQGVPVILIPAGTGQSSASTSAHADFRRFEIGFLASYLRLDGANLTGGELSFAVNLNRRFAIVAAVDVHEDVDFSALRFTTYRFGARYALLRTSRVRGFVEATAGGAHQRIPSFDDVNGFAFDAGGGFDLNIRPWIAWRMAKVDYALIRASGNTTDGVRAGTGVVFRFGHK